MSRPQQSPNYPQRQVTASHANAPNGSNIFAQSSGCPQISPNLQPQNSITFFGQHPVPCCGNPSQPFVYPPHLQALQQQQIHYVMPVSQFHQPADTSHPTLLQYHPGMIQTNGGVSQPTVTQPYVVPVPVQILQSTAMQMSNPNIVTTMPAAPLQPQQNMQRQPSTLFRPQMSLQIPQQQPPKPRRFLCFKKPEEQGGGNVIIEPKPKDEVANNLVEVNEEKEEKIKKFHDTIVGGAQSNFPAELPLTPTIESSLPVDNLSAMEVDEDEVLAQPTIDENTVINCDDEQKSQTPDSGMLSEDDEGLHKDIKDILEFKVPENEAHNLEQRIYHREFLILLRSLKIGESPIPEAELKRIGLSREGMPESPPIRRNPPRDEMSAQSASTNQKPKFTSNSSDFKPSWQLNQQSQQSSLTIIQRPHLLNNRNSGGDSRGRYKNCIGRSSYGHQCKKSGPPRGGGQFSQMTTSTSQQSDSQEENSSVVVKSSDSTEIQQKEEQEDLLRKSANIWKPKRSAQLKDEEEQKYDNLKKEIRGLLNKITPSTFEDLTQELCEHEIYKDSKLLTIIIDLIFDKAVEEPHFCPIYSDLCKKQVTEEWEKGSSKEFKKAIIFKCQNSFLASKEYDKKMEELEMKLNELNKSNEKGKEQIKEEQEMRRFKEKRRVLGYMKFVGQLYRHLLLSESIADWCLQELIKRFQSTCEEDYLEYTVELIETIGKTYEQQLEKNSAIKLTMAQMINKPECKDRVKQTILHLAVNIKPHASYRIRFAIMDLEELQRRKWIKRGGEKGPKTIDQVRKEAEEEQRRNESERMEHEMEKKRERETKQVLRSGYNGRNSLDRRYIHPQHQHRPHQYQGRWSMERQYRQNQPQNEGFHLKILQRERQSEQPQTHQSRLKQNLQGLDDLPPTNKQSNYSKQQQSSLGMKEEEGDAGPSTSSAANEDDKWRKEDNAKNAPASIGKDESK